MILKEIAFSASVFVGNLRDEVANLSMGREMANLYSINNSTK